jgi:hypothetical protein
MERDAAAHMQTLFALSSCPPPCIIGYEYRPLCCGDTVAKCFLYWDLLVPTLQYRSMLFPLVFYQGRK